MRLGWFPRDQKFYDMFEEVVGLIAQAAQVFVELVEHFDHRERRVGELRQLEHNCDGAVARILAALGRAFVTPLDREDIHALATSLDDVLDNMEEAAHRLNAFQIDRPTPEALKMALLIHQAVGYLQRAVQLCRRQLSSAEMAHALREITRLENEADAVFRNAEADLFAHPPDMLSLVKWKDLYEWLEATMDACRHVAHIINNIVVKGS